MDFWTEFSNTMFWFVAPLILCLPISIAILLVWGVGTAVIFDSIALVGVFGFAFLVIALTEITGNKMYMRLMSSDGLVGLIVRKNG